MPLLNQSIFRQKVLYLLTKSDIGGAQKYVHDLAASVDARGFTSRVLYGEREVRWLSNRIYPHLFFINDIIATIEVFLILKSERPHIFHLNSSKAGVIGSFAAFLYNFSKPRDEKIKVVFTAHGWVFNPSNDLLPYARLAYRILHRCAALFQDIIINVSEYDRLLALRYRIAPPEKLITIWNGIDYKNLHFLDKVSARRKIMETYENDVPHSARDIWIGSVGRLVREKNYATFVEAAFSLPQNLKFFIIGEGPERASLERLIAKLGLGGRFTLPGAIEHAGTLVTAFDIFVLSSMKEGLPYTLLEAMAGACPAIVTDIGGMPEVVRQAPESGIIIPPRNPQQLAEAILALIDAKDKIKEFGDYGKLKVERIFNLQRMTEETLALAYSEGRTRNTDS
jgi:glycosyltransferase involved in cell wall biosynthesis